MLTKHLSSSVKPEVRFIGANYFNRGRVKIVESDESSVFAKVKGTQLYTVNLVVEEKNHDSCLKMYCSCPYFQERLSTCYHIWATLLAANANGVFASNATRPPTHLRADEDLLEEEDIEGGDGKKPVEDQRPPIWKKPVNRKKNQKKLPKALLPPPWKAPLEQLQRLAQLSPRESTSSKKRDRQLLYVIDLPQSLSKGQVTLEVLFRDRKQDGEWSKPQSRHLGVEDIELLENPNDRRILSLLLGANRGHSDYGGYTSFSPNSSVLRLGLPARLHQPFLPEMCETGRCVLRLGPDRIDSTPLKWDGDPWTFACEWFKSADGKTMSLVGLMKREGILQSLVAPGLTHLPGLVLEGTTLSPFDDAGMRHWSLVLRKSGKIDVPLALKDQFLEDVSRLPSLPTLAFPPEFDVREHREPPRRKLTVSTSPESYRQRFLVAKLMFQYGDVEFPYPGGRTSKYSADRRQFTVRDTAAEHAAITRLVELGIRWKQHYRNAGFEFPATKLPKIVAELTREGWIVEAEGKLYRSGGSIAIEVSSNIDWFELHAKVDFDGQSVPLPRLLQALKKGENMVVLDDGSYGLLPEDWLKKYGVFAAVGQAEGDHVRFEKAQVGLLDALLAAQPEATFDAAFKKARDRFQSFEGVRAAAPPPSFQGELRGYQSEGLGWMRFLQEFGWGGCLADDMGLGKTVQVLALLADRVESRPKGAARTSLVVVPRSLLFNWKSEASRFAPQLKVLEHHSPDRTKNAADFDAYDVVLTTYGIARKDAAILAERRFDYCILDESQAIKNASTEQAKAVRVLKADHRLAMSGTPIENHLGELWSLFEFLNPGMLGHASIFKATGAGARNPEPETRALLAKALRPFILRRTKDQVAKDLPAKTEQTVFCDLEPEQRKLYDELRDFYRTSLLAKISEVGMNKAKIMVLEALLRLRQAACHPGLIDKSKSNDASAKLDVLMPKLHDVFEEGHKALVFSQFTSLLSLVKKRLDADGIPYEYLDGKTRDRAAPVDRFQNDPDCKLFLISLKAGGVGLNLTAAEYVFLLDPWWNPAVEAQAIDRTHRIGQTKPVFAYRLIARGTVEEKVLELQNTKRALADAILNADNKGGIASLSKEDLELLLS